MGTTLTGTTPQDTYDSLIKVTDNGPLSGTLKALSDGLGNDSTLSLSTTAASIAGTLAVAGAATFDTNTLVVDAANNRVGVGTNTPQYKVQVDGSADTDIVASTSSNTNSAIVSTFNSNASSGNFMQLRSYGAGTSGTLFGASVAKANTLWSNSDALMAIGTIGATPLIFGTSNAERVRITATGNVGIGTDSPLAKLDVRGTTYLTSTGGDGTLADAIIFGNSGFPNTQSNRIRTTTSASAVGNKISIEAGNGTTGSYVDNQLILVGTGNVGIGNNNPAAPLEVKTSGVGYRVQITNLSGQNLIKSLDGNQSTYRDLNYDALQHIYRISGTEQMRLDSSGNLSITSGSIALTGAGEGIFLGGSIGSANGLDDYEEGTWTMGISFGGASVGITYSLNSGFYTKIGRQVSVTGLVRLTNKGTSTGDARITGLPFTISAANAGLCSASIRPVSVSFANQILAIGINNTTEIGLQETTEAGAITQITDANFANNSDFIVSLTYFV